MSVKYNGLVEHPNTHFEGTLPTNGFIENKLIISGASGEYSPATGTTATNSTKVFATIDLRNHISGETNFLGQRYRMSCDLTWSGYTSGKAQIDGAVNGAWTDTNWFAYYANQQKTLPALYGASASGTYHYNFNVYIGSANDYTYQFRIRADSANAGTYYKIENICVYSYNGGIDKDKMSFNHYYEW